MACFLAVSLQDGAITPTPATPIGETIHLIQAGRREGIGREGPGLHLLFPLPGPAWHQGLRETCWTEGGLVRVYEKNEGWREKKGRDGSRCALLVVKQTG